MDYSKFLGSTDQVIEREFIQDADIGDDYVEGSQGQLKKLIITAAENVKSKEYNSKIQKKIFKFKYQDPARPSEYTSIEKLSEETETNETPDNLAPERNELHQNRKGPPIDIGVGGN